MKCSAVLVASSLVALMIDQRCCGQYYLTTSASLRSDSSLFCAPEALVTSDAHRGSNHSRNSTTSCMRLLALLVKTCHHMHIYHYHYYIIQKLANAQTVDTRLSSKKKKKEKKKEKRGAGFEARPFPRQLYYNYTSLARILVQQL